MIQYSYLIMAHFNVLEALVAKKLKLKKTFKSMVYYKLLMLIFTNIMKSIGT